MPLTKIIDRQYALIAVANVLPKHVGAGNGFTIVLQPGSLLTRVGFQTTTGFNGTTPTATITDGTTVFANAVDVATAGAETVANAPKLYPTGGTLTISLAGTGVTTGEAYAFVEYVIKDRGNEIVN